MVMEGIYEACWGWGGDIIIKPDESTCSVLLRCMPAYMHIHIDARTHTRTHAHKQIVLCMLVFKH